MSTQDLPYDAALFAKRLKGEGRQLGNFVKLYVDFGSRRSDFQACLNALNAAAKFSSEHVSSKEGPIDEYASHILRSVSAHAILMYGRGADPHGGRSKALVTEWLSPEDIAKHDAIWKLRNKVFAHHVQQDSHESGIWLFETALLKIKRQPGPWAIETSTFLHRANFRRDITQDLLNLAPKHIKALEERINTSSSQVVAEIGRILRKSPLNHTILEQCYFDKRILETEGQVEAVIRGGRGNYHDYVPKRLEYLKG